MLTLTLHGGTQIGAAPKFTVTEVSGLGPVAVPTNTDALREFLGLQRAINAFIRKNNIVGASAIAVDGRLGPGTRTMYNLVVGFISGMERTSSITSLALAAGDDGHEIALAARSEYDASIPARLMPGRTTVTTPTTTLTAKDKLPSPLIARISPKPLAKSKALWWIVGLLAVAGVATFGVVTYRRRSA